GRRRSGPARARAASARARRTSASRSTARRRVSGRWRRRARGELGLRADEQHVGIAQDLLRLEWALGKRKLGEGEIELAVLDEAQQVGGVGLFAYPHLDSGPRRDEVAEEGGEDARADALEDPDAQRARRSSGERG